MKRILLITITFLMIGNVSADLDGYNCSKEIILTGNTSGAQTDYQILLNISYEENMQSDFSDLRFYNETNQIDAWLESKINGSYALVWVEFPSTPSNTVEQTYYMHYGKVGAMSDWHATNTFLHAYDQHSLWTEYDPNSHIVIDQTAQTVTLTNVNRNEAARVIGAASVSGDFIVEWEAIYSDFIAFAGTGLGDLDEIAGTIDNSIMGIIEHNGILYVARRTADVYNSSNSAGALSLDTQYYMRMERIGSDVYLKAYSDVKRTNLIQSATVAGAPTGIFTYGFVWNSYGDAVNSAGSGVLSKYRVRKYVANPPTYEFGAESCEDISGLTTINFYYPHNNTTTDIKYISDEGYNTITNNYLSAKNLSVIIIKDQIVSEDIITNPSKLMDIKYFTLFVFLTLFIVSIIALIKIIKRGA